MAIAFSAIRAVRAIAIAVSRPSRRHLSPVDEHVVEQWRHFAVGAAAGLRRYIAEAEGMEQGMDSAKKVLKEVSELDEGSKLAAMILEMYALILEGKTIRELLKAADEVKAAAACRVI